MAGITTVVKEEIAGSGITQGVCVITALSAGVAVLVTSSVKQEVRLDVMEELERMIVPRLWAQAEVAGADIMGAAIMGAAITKAAITKAAITGGSLDITIHDGKPALASGQGIFLADYIGSGELEFLVTCC